MEKQGIESLVLGGRRDICDNQKATERNLKDRIDNLAQKGEIPERLTEAAHSVRLLGNEGAHEPDAEVSAEDASKKYGSLTGKYRPTQRAADLGYAARFSAVFLALSFFRFDGESTLPPTAANAHRWAAEEDG